jgi:cholesterol transport system auxiliary component
MNAQQERGIGRRRFVMLALAALLGGCAGLPPPGESQSLYVLAAGPLPRTKGPRHDLVLEVAAPRAGPGFDTSRMAYVRQAFELDYFATHRWADTPSRMLGPLLVGALDQCGGFRAVTQVQGSVRADLRLDSEIVRLQQDFSVRPSREEIALRVQLTDVRERRVVATRVFEEVENAPSDDPVGGVIAANSALQRLLQRVADFCVAEAAGR